MKIQQLGFTKELEIYRTEQNLDNFDVARVISEHKERYIVRSDKGEYEAEIVGNLRYTASSRADFPAVGDWVAVSPYDENKVLIHQIYSRKTSIERQALGKHGEKQLIATNVDHAFIVQAVDRDFNLNRMERYLTICHNANVEPIIVLNKIDLISEEKLQQLITDTRKRMPGISIIAISNHSLNGYTTLRELLKKGHTYCLLGSSGVGKSTLTNNLLGQDQMKTEHISNSTHKGRHITSHRELFVLPHGGILIDNPGMREVGITDTTSGIEMTFDQLYEAAKDCRYSDCTHQNETGCAVIDAVENGTIDEAIYQHYLKLQKEQSYFESTVADKRKKDKTFGKMMKNFKSDLDKLGGKHKDHYKKK